MTFRDATKCQESCSGKCVFIDEFVGPEYYKCIATSTYYLCKNGAPTYWITVGAFVAINLILYLAAHLHGGYKSSLCSIIVSIVQNFVFMVLIMCITCLAVLKDINPVYFSMIHIVIFVTIVMNVVTFAIGKKGCCESQGRKVMWKNNDDDADLTNDDPNSYITKAHYNPPIIKLKGYCSYQRMRLGTNYVDYLPYQTWRADSAPEHVEAGRMTLINVKHEFVLSEGLQVYKTDREQWHELAAGTNMGLIMEKKWSNKVYCVKKHKMIGSSCFYSFINSCFGKFIFFLLHIPGFSAAFENVFGLTFDVINVKTNRTLSDNNDLPIPAYTADPKGVGCNSMTRPPIPDLPMTASLPNQLIYVLQNMEREHQITQQQMNERMMAIQQYFVEQHQMVTQQQMNEQMALIRQLLTYTGAGQQQMMVPPQMMVPQPMMPQQQIIIPQQQMIVPQPMMSQEQIIVPGMPTPSSEPNPYLD